MEFHDWLFDKRVLRRNIRKGVLSRHDYKRYLEDLVDASTNIAPNEEEASSPDPTVDDGGRAQALPSATDTPEDAGEDTP